MRSVSYVRKGRHGNFAESSNYSPKADIMKKFASEVGATIDNQLLWIAWLASLIIATI